MDKIVFLHGFSQEDALQVMRAVKAVAPEPEKIAFSMSTPTNMEWKVKDLIKEVWEEHEYMQQNPPKSEE